MQPEKRCPATTWSCFNASLQRTKCFYLGGLQRICSPSLPPSLFLDLAAIMHLGLISWAETITRLRLSARESKNVDFSFLDTKGLEYEFTESTYSICHINFRTFCLPMASSVWCVRKIMRYSEKITGHDNRWMCLFLSFGQTKSVPILESLPMFIFYLELSAPVASHGSPILVLKFQHECFLLRQAFPDHPSTWFHLTQPPIMSSFYFLFRIYLLFSCSLLWLLLQSVLLLPLNRMEIP